MPGVGSKSDMATPSTNMLRELSEFYRREMSELDVRSNLWSGRVSNSENFSTLIGSNEAPDMKSSPKNWP